MQIYLLTRSIFFPAIVSIARFDYRRENLILYKISMYIRIKPIKPIESNLTFRFTNSFANQVEGKFSLCTWYELRGISSVESFWYLCIFIKFEKILIRACYIFIVKIGLLLICWKYLLLKVYLLLGISIGIYWKNKNFHGQKFANFSEGLAPWKLFYIWFIAKI